MHDELKDAMKKIQQVAKANDKRCGVYSTAGDQARQFADQGFQMVRLLWFALTGVADVGSRSPW